MKKLVFLSLALLMVAGVSYAKTFTVECDANTGQCDANSLKEYAAPAPVEPESSLVGGISLSVAVANFIGIVFIIWRQRHFSESERRSVPDGSVQ